MRDPRFPRLCEVAVLCRGDAVRRPDAFRTWAVAVVSLARNRYAEPPAGHRRRARPTPQSALNRGLGPHGARRGVVQRPPRAKGSCGMTPRRRVAALAFALMGPFVVATAAQPATR